MVNPSFLDSWLTHIYDKISTTLTCNVTEQISSNYIGDSILNIVDKKQT